MRTFLPKSGIFTVVFLIANLFFSSSSFGQNTGLLPPTTSASINSVTTVGNGLASDNAYAVFDSSGDQADYGGFGISIPAGATILGIEVQLEGNRTSGRDLNIQLTWNNKANFTANKLMTSFGGTDALRTVGSSTDTWGHSPWAISEFGNGIFFVRITSTGGGGNVNLDQVLVRVYYCTQPTITASSTAAAVCFSASSQTTTLAYTATTNSPTSYSIAWTGMANQSSTAFAFSAGGGTITGITIPASTAAGTYNGTMTITNAGGCTSTTPISVTVNALPTANAGAALSPICQGGTSAALGGSVGGTATGGTWSDGGIGGTFSPSDTDLNATWTPPPGYSGTATLTLTSSGGSCGTKTASKTQVVNIQPTASAGETQTICSNKTAIISGTATNGTIVWTVEGGAAVGTLDNPNIASPTFTPDQYFEGTATLTMTVTNAGCVAVSATSVVIVNGGAATVDPGPNTAICMSTPGEVPLSGIIGGGASSGTWSGGNGTFFPNDSDLATSYTPTQAEIDSGSVTLTLTSEDPGGLCPGAVSRSMTITFKTAPTATAGGSQSICTTGTATVSGAISSNGTILWTHNGTGSLSNATTLTPTYTPSVSDGTADYGNGLGVVTLTMTVSNSPCPNATATYTVTVISLPSNRTLSGATTICSGNTATIQVLNSEEGVQYQLRNNIGNVLMGAPVAGNGGTIDLPTDPLTATTTFNVLASTMTNPSCPAQMPGTITITVNPAPLNRTVAAAATALCSGNGTNITVAASTNTTTTYQLRNNADNTPIGSPVTGNGGTINLPTGNLTNITSSPIVITYNVLATITATGCTAQMSVTPSVTVNPVISNNVISSDQFICSNTTPATLTGVPTGGAGAGTYTYGWFQSTDNFNTNNVNATGTRTNQEYSPPSLTQTMWYRRSVSSDGCLNSISPAVKITVNPLPIASYTVTGGGDYCAGGVGMPVGLTNSQTNVNYQLFLNGSPSGAPVAGTNGSAITFGNQTAAGTYTVVATDVGAPGGTNCTSNMTGSVTITVKPVPETTGVVICPGESGALTGSCPNPNVNTGSKNPGTAASATGSGTAWTNFNNILTDNNAYATAATTAFGGAITTNSLQATNFDFSAIPNTATILGIQIAINRFSSVASVGDYVRDNTVSLMKAGAITGSNYAATLTDWLVANTTVVSYGGASDLWGTTWSPAEIKASNFGVALSANIIKSGFNVNTASVDNVTVTVYYLANGVLNWYTASSGGVSIGTGSPFNPVGVLDSGLADTNTAGTTHFYAECSSVPGCRTETNFVINPKPIMTCPGDSTVCIDKAPYALTGASPVGGTYSGTGVSANNFDPATAGVGPHIITYSYTDGNGCSNSCTFTITVNEAVVASGTQVNVLCNGESTGSIDLSVNGGSGDYTYLWSNGETTQDISGLAASATPYSVTITELNGCAVTGTTSFTITESAPVFASGTQVNVLCNGLSTGSIDLTVTGGSGNYTYLWNDGNTDEDRSGLATGTYSVTITESNGCTVNGTTSFTIEEPAVALATNITTPTHVNCYGGNTGSATVVVSGGTPGYTYLWKDGNGDSIGQTTDTASGLVAGNYSVIVTDADGNGCVSTAYVTIEQPIEVTVSATGTNPVCYGSTPGTIVISNVSSGATTIIQLDGSGPDLSDQATFAPGTYLITASAPNYYNDGVCTATASVTITEPAEVTVDATSTNVTCHDAADGTITIIGLSAGATTIIQKDGVGIDLSAQTTFAPGSYKITASAPNGNNDGFCTAVDWVTITEPNELTASITAQTDVDCFGNSNGSATVEASGGTLEYSYSWNDPSTQTAATASGLAAGDYTVTVTDGNGCTAQATAHIIVNDNELPTVITKNIDVYLNPTSANISASDIDDGSHDNCGIQSRTVLPNTFTCANVGPNTVTLTVTDTNGKVNTNTAIVTVKDSIKPVISGMPINKTVTLSGGNCSALVKWTAPTATDNCGVASLVSNDDTYNENGSTLLGIGVHTIIYTATDVNGNVKTASFTVTVLDHTPPTITNCPANVTVNNDNNTCGARVYYIQPNVNDCNGATLSINNTSYLSGNIFPVGTTTVVWTATDGSSNVSQCSFTVTVVDNQAPVPNLASLPTITGECSATALAPTATDNCDGTITGEPDGPTSFNTPGLHTIVWTYTDSHGKSSTQNQTVNITATPPAINTQPVALTKCEGQSATFSVSTSGTGFQWQVDSGSGWGDLGGETNSSLTIDPVTIGMNGNKYRVIVSDLCTSIPSDEALLTVSSPITVSDQPDQALCNTSSFTMTQSEPSPGTGTWTLVSGSATINDIHSPTTTITNVVVGTSATVKWTVINGGCSGFDEVTVTNRVMPSVSDQPNQTLCNSSSFTMTQSIPSVGTGIWTLESGSAIITNNNSPTTTITGVPSGTSAIVKWTVTNGSCSASDEVTLTNGEIPSVSDQANQNLCNTSSFTMTQSEPSVGAGIWTLVNGSATITDSHSPTTTITGVAVGTSAKIRWTVTSGSCSAFDDVTVTNTILPSVSNQPDQTLCNTSSFTMTQSAPSAGNGSWAFVGSSGSAIITTPSSPTTTITGVVSGTSVTVRWTVSNVDCSSYDDVTLTNATLVSVTDQPNQALCNTSSFTMTQSAPSLGSGAWTLISGSANITSSNSPTTTITGVAIGTSATVRWTVTSGSCSSYDEVTVSNTAVPTVSNQPDQVQCNTSTFTMTQSGSGTWTFVGSFGSAIITTPNSPTTTITGVAAGTSVTARWTVGTGSCTANDDVILTNNTTAPSVSDQPDQTKCNTSTFTMTQSGSGTWTFVGSYGSAVITTPTSPTTTVTGVAVGTNVTVRWTVVSGSCTAYDDVKLTNNAGASFTASIATSSPDAFCSGLTLTANTSVSGSYSYLWSPGGATTPSITLYNSSSAGTYTVTVTQIGGCSGTAQASYNFQPQNVINDYTILGINDVNLGNKNYVQTGSVGVTTTLGYARIGSNSTVAGPGAFVKARFITVGSGSNVPARIYSPAVVILPNNQVNNTSTTGLPDLNIPNNTTVTKTGNYRNVTIGSNCNVTFTTGTIFNNLNIGKSTQVKFNANNTGVLNVNSISLADGTDAAPSKLIFASDISVRVKTTVSIGKSSLVNPTGGYKAVFFIGGNEFRVQPGGNVSVNASVFAPNGTIRVDGDAVKNTYMKGFYIGSKVLSSSSNIYWNQFDCANPSAKPDNIDNILAKGTEPETIPVLFDVKAYPNPSNYQFTLEVEGSSTEKVEVEVYDMSGRHIKHIVSDFNQPIVLGEDLPAGTYLTIVNQGSNRKALKLIKK